MPEQKERLELFCKLKNYEIIDYYIDEGISAKRGNYRPEYERLQNDIKSKRINTIVALKLDRITRSVYDWEDLITFLEDAFCFIIQKACIISIQLGLILVAHYKYLICLE